MITKPKRTRNMLFPPAGRGSAKSQEKGGRPVGLLGTSRPPACPDVPLSSLAQPLTPRALQDSYGSWEVGTKPSVVPLSSAPCPVTIEIQVLASSGSEEYTSPF